MWGEVSETDHFHVHPLSKYAHEATLQGLYCERWREGLTSDGNLEWSAPALEY